jgi:hypothetical protein
VEQQLQLFQRAMDAAEEGAATLRAANAALAASEARAAGDVAAGAAEARRLAGQVRRGRASRGCRGSADARAGRAAPDVCIDSRLR